MFYPATLRRALGAFAALTLAVWPMAVSAGPMVQIKSLSYEAERHSLVLDITGPVTISTRSLSAPARLVVDVPATLVSKNHALEIHDGLIERVRISQFKILPPTVRVVLETAGETEPLIAVQQTANKLYITLAPARPDEGESGHDLHDHAHEAPSPAVASPSAAPAKDKKPAVVAPASPKPSAMPRPQPTATPSPQPTPAASVTPAKTPSPRPAVSPKPAQPAPQRSKAPAVAPQSGEMKGESSYESLPTLPSEEE